MSINARINPFGHNNVSETAVYVIAVAGDTEAIKNPNKQQNISPRELTIESPE